MRYIPIILILAVIIPARLMSQTNIILNQSLSENTEVLATSSITLASGFASNGFSFEGMVETNQSGVVPETKGHEIQLGTGTLTTGNSADDTPTPFGTFYEDGKSQYMIRSEELNALGFEAGYIHSLSFDVAGCAGIDLSNFKLSISSYYSFPDYTPVPYFYSFNFTTVYSGSLKLETGWNKIVFSQPYYWDGSGNMIIETCFDNDSLGGSHSTVHYTNYDYNYTTVISMANDASGCSLSASKLSTGRPNMKFSVVNDIPYSKQTFSGSYPSMRSSDKNYIHTITPLTEVSSLSFTAGKPVNEFNETIQYFDGIGRPCQSIEVASLPTGKDLVQVYEYDGFGRESKKYLPFPKYGNFGAYVPDAVGELFDYYDADENNYAWDKYYPYASIDYEASPLNRVVAEHSAGVSGTITAKTYAYQTNTASEVRSMELSFSGMSVTSITSINNYYNAGELYKVKAIDENGNPITTYTDIQGKTIMKVAVTDGTLVKTCYLYNNQEQLCMVIPPEAMAYIDANSPSTIDISNDIIKNLCYYYEYDNENHMTQKKLPGADPVYMVYDERDRLVATQDGNLRNPNNDNNYSDACWTFTKYDDLNRPVIAGIIETPNIITQSSMQGYVDNITIEYETIAGISGTWFGYSNNSFPVLSTSATDLINNIFKYKELHSITYYDRYDFDNDGNNDFGSNFIYKPGLNYISANDAAYLPNGFIGAVTATRIFINDEDNNTPNNLLTVNYYDKFGRVLQGISDNHLGGYDVVSTKYNYTGQPETSKQQLTAKLNSASVIDFNVRITEDYSYDHTGRLLETLQTIEDVENEVTYAPVNITANKYNNLGRLTEKYLHVANNNALQRIDYQYNIRGWLQSINDPVSLGTDKFAMKLYYYLTLNSSTPPCEAQYNGNINAVDWNNGSGREGYIYYYDGLNRLRSAQYVNITNDGSWGVSGGKYFANVTYDLNGNIKTLQRSGNVANTGSIDLLNYTYYSNSNQLSSVTDNSTYNSSEGFVDGNKGTDDYSYDKNGNMKSDANKGITTISYNYLNLPTSVTKNNGTHTYTYSAGGVKLRNTASSGKITDYLGNFVFEKRPADSRSLNYILFSEGRIILNQGNIGYEYNLKDHLGNTRVVINQNSDVLQIADYYPFGMRHEPVTGLGTNNRYLYNGKELQEETDWLDYGWRMYDPVLGRFTSMDPLTDFMPGITPYNYAFNNPVSMVDVDGLSPEDRQRRQRERHLRQEKREREREQRREQRQRDRNLNPGMRYNPNFTHIAAHEPGERWNPPKPPEYKVTVDDNIDISDPEIEIGDVSSTILEPIKMKDDPWNPNDFLTGKKDNLPTVFDTDCSYISRNQADFKRWLNGMAALLNQRGLTIQITVFTAYEKGSKLANDDYYSSPGVKVKGVSTDLMDDRATTIDNALKKAGIKNALKTNKQYKTGGGKNHTIFIQIY